MSAPARDADVSSDRLDEILTGLNGCIRYRYAGGEPERDWDPADFVAYAKSVPEVDWARTDDPEGEIWLLDGTRLVFGPIMPAWPAWGMSWEADESQPSMLIGRAAI